MKLLIALLAAFALNIPAFASPPNIVLMLVDDMGVMDTSVPFLTDSEGRPKRMVRAIWSGRSRLRR